MATTLADLMENNYPSGDVLETFRDYAESGAAISSHSIKTILDKAQLTREELDAAYQHMQTGMARQIAFGQGIAGLEYFQAMNCLAQMLAGTMSAEEVSMLPDNELLASLRRELIKAHHLRSREHLEQAVGEFKKYVLQANPAEFGEGEVRANLTQPGQEGIFPKVYNLRRYGGEILVHAYMMGIHATDDFQIAEAPARE